MTTITNKSVGKNTKRAKATRMVISQAEKKRRMGFIGASDIGGIFGVCPFKSRAEVWSSKCWPTEKEARNDIAELGNYLEPSVLAWAAEVTGLGTYVEGERFVREPFACNLDGRFIDHPVVIEAKTTAHEGDWGENGTSEIPPRVMLQVQAQMACSGSTKAAVPMWWLKFHSRTNMIRLMNAGWPAEKIVEAHEPDIERRLYWVDFDPDVWEEIKAECMRFWHEVETKTKPTGPPPSLDFLKMVVRDGEHEAHIEGNEDLILRWLTAKEEARAAYAHSKRLQEELLFLLDQAEIGVCPSGILQYTKDRAGRRVLRWKPDRTYQQEGSGENDNGQGTAGTTSPSVPGPGETGSP